MRIVCTDLSSFLANLDGVRAYRDVVYYECSDRPINGKSRHDATSFEVFYQLSTVLEFADGGQALLVCGINCGIDRTTGDGGLEGSASRKVMHEKLERYCSSNKLKLLPGVLDQ